MKDRIYFMLPHFFQNLLVTLFNIIAYRQRYGKEYWRFRELFKRNASLSRESLLQIQRERYAELVKHAVQKSDFYRRLYQGIESPENIDHIKRLPIVTKEMLRAEMTAAYTIAKSDGIVSKTGGTTGKSLEVLFTKTDIQERFAMLDHFRGNLGYELGKRTAWFSGKNLISHADIGKSRFWKTDAKHRVRYYSTFHIKDEFLKHYIKNLKAFRPEYMVGFPSSMISIAQYGLRHGIAFPAGMVKAIFPTAETITDQVRETLEAYFKAPVYDQYASSEGAPFILECPHRKLHLELQSGVFEVIGDDGNPAQSGRMIVTSFTTHGTPLIRYDISDRITLADGVCLCGSQNPLVASISGRIDDFVYSPENGKINLGNVSNTLKDTKGILSFQVVQDSLDAIEIMLVTDPGQYDTNIENTFIRNWRHRVGDQMAITLRHVAEIPVEKSGKFRMVKNNIKDQIDH